MDRFLAALLATAGIAFGATVARAENPRLAPVPRTEAASTHGPYEMGACDTCHERPDPGDPGAAVKATNELCTDCHEEFGGAAPVKMERSVHPSSKSACTLCHNPHNSRKKKLRL